MIRGKKVIVILPAYNAEKTLQNTYSEIPRDIVDEILLVDDASSDKTCMEYDAVCFPIVILHYLTPTASF